MKRYLSIMFIISLMPFLNVLSASAAKLPSLSRIQRDVVGHKISEGLAKCFHSEDWYWKIEENGIKNLKIEKTLRSTVSEYVVEVSCILSGVHSSYKTRMRVTYLNEKGSGWELDYVKSLGMRRILTHRYDDCIKAAIGDDGWGGVTCLQITNVTNIPLEIGCDYLAGGVWRRMAVSVGAGQKVGVGGTFGGGRVTDFKIKYIERP